MSKEYKRLQTIIDEIDELVDATSVWETTCHNYEYRGGKEAGISIAKAILSKHMEEMRNNNRG